jgi:hypothetical protein
VGEPGTTVAVRITGAPKAGDAGEKESVVVVVVRPCERWANAGRSIKAKETTVAKQASECAARFIL